LRGSEFRPQAGGRGERHSGIGPMRHTLRWRPPKRQFGRGLNGSCHQAQSPHGP
jgi:hypothetical protein